MINQLNSTSVIQETPLQQPLSPNIIEVPVKPKKNLFSIILSVSVVILVAVIVVMAYFLLNNKNIEDNSNQNTDKSDTVANLNDVEDETISNSRRIVAGTVYNESDKTQTLYAWNDGVEKIVYATTNGSNENIQILNIVSDNELYFITKNTSDIAEIKKYFFSDGSISSVVLDHQIYIPGVVNSTTLVFIETVPKNLEDLSEALANIVFYNFETKVDQVVCSLTFTILGRGVGATDSMQIRVSEDLKHMYYINTFGSGSYDSAKINVYELTNVSDKFTASQLTTIENATVPVWKGNAAIIYLNVSDNKAYEYLLNTAQSSIIEGVGDNGYKFSYNETADKLLYSADGFDTSTTSLYVYDFKAKASTKLYPMAWAHWLDENTIWINKFEKCPLSADECGMITDFMLKSGEVFDISSDFSLKDTDILYSREMYVL